MRLLISWLLNNIVEHAKGTKEPGQDGVSQVNEAAKPIRRNHWAAAEQAGKMSSRQAREMMNQLLQSTNDKVAGGVAAGGIAVGSSKGKQPAFL